MPKRKTEGRPAKHSFLEILNGIFYITQDGCSWRMLPHDLPPWKTVYRYLRIWRIDGTLEKIHFSLYGKVRAENGRNEQPSAGIIDSQTVKTSSGERGDDAGKKIKGRKRHIIVDTMGLLLKVLVHPDNIQDRDGAKLLLGKGCL